MLCISKFSVFFIVFKLLSNQMKPQLLSSSLLIFFIILIFINNTSYAVDDDKFTQCKRGYGCGFIKDVRYPFWGDDTPSYCGRPGFKLSCLADGFPALNYGTLRFGVQEINHPGQMMRLTRNDLWGSSCPETFYNTTLDYSLFDYAQTVRNLTLFYNCTSQLPKQALNNFTCLVNGTQTGALYGNESFFRLNGLLNYTSSCSVSIQVPVFQTTLDSMVDGKGSLRDALYRGFDVVYGFPESNNCSTCEASGGVCGSNSTLLGFVCFCSNGTYPLQCPTVNVSQTGTTVTLVNRCDYIVWPGVRSSTSGSAINITGFELTPNSSRSLRPQVGWTGSIWGRTGCNFDLESGQGSCATGDCNSTRVECNGKGAIPPVTLAEFTLASANNQDFYDVSLVDGYNLPMTVEASGGSGSCQPTGCITDVNKQCPPELQFEAGKACKGACQAFGTSEYCCTGEYSSPSTCKPSNYSEMFKKACPRAYAYPYDDIISLFTCSRADYTITFCPSLTNLIISNDAPPPTMTTGPPDWLGPGPGNTPTGRGNSINSKMKIGIGSGVGIVGILIICISIYCFKWKVSSNSVFCWKGKTKNDEKVEAFIRQCEFLGPKRFTYLEVKKITNSFKDKLGQGGFGDVYRGKLHDGRLVAAKVLNTSKGNGEDFINEVASISQTSHMNVVALLGFCLEGHKRALVYEFMPNGSLEKFIYSSDDPLKIGDNGQLGYEKLHQIAVGIAQGLDYLHQKCNTRILHFDIKPHNILLDEDFCPKISDFGLAKLCPKKESKVSMLEARGTIGYIAPEVFNRNFGGVSYKSDVYSYGMMVLEMVGGRKNINVKEGDRTSEIYFPHWVYKRLELDDDLRLQGVMMNEEENMIARKMILVGLWCIQTNPSNRPSMSEVINMLEGSIDTLPIPPKPFLSSPSRTPVNSSTLSTTLGP